MYKLIIFINQKITHAENNSICNKLALNLVKRRNRYINFIEINHL